MHCSARSSATRGIGRASPTSQGSWSEVESSIAPKSLLITFFGIMVSHSAHKKGYIHRLRNYGLLVTSRQARASGLSVSVIPPQMRTSDGWRDDPVPPRALAHRSLRSLIETSSTAHNLYHSVKGIWKDMCLHPVAHSRGRSFLRIHMKDEAQIPGNAR